jgi:hypothetical protein
MDRRRFLSLLAVGAPAAIVAERVGLLEKMRTYFFAPRAGWNLYTPYLNANGVRSGIGRDYVLYGGARGGGKGLLAQARQDLRMPRNILYYHLYGGARGGGKGLLAQARQDLRMPRNILYCHQVRPEDMNWRNLDRS